MPAFAEAMLLVIDHVGGVGGGLGGDVTVAVAAVDDPGPGGGAESFTVDTGDKAEFNAGADCDGGLGPELESDGDDMPPF